MASTDIEMADTATEAIVLDDSVMTQHEESDGEHRESAGDIEESADDEEESSDKELEEGYVKVAGHGR